MLLAEIVVAGIDDVRGVAAGTHVNVHDVHVGGVLGVGEIDEAGDDAAARGRGWRVRVLDGERERVAAGEDVAIESGLPLDGRIAFEMRRAGMLRVRIPEWCDGASVQVDVNGVAFKGEVTDGYIALSGLAAGASGEVRFPVACKMEKETVDSMEYTTTWVCNQIVDIQPRGVVSPLPF